MLLLLVVVVVVTATAPPVVLLAVLLAPVVSIISQLKNLNIKPETVGCNSTTIKNISLRRMSFSLSSFSGFRRTRNKERYGAKSRRADPSTMLRICE